jgi:hypothetical protein
MSQVIRKKSQMATNHKSQKKRETDITISNTIPTTPT